MMQYLSYLATALVLIGVYYISIPRVRGQFIMLAADTTWFLYAFQTHQWALVIQSIILASLAVSAINNWRNEGIQL